MDFTRLDISKPCSNLAHSKSKSHKISSIDSRSYFRRRNLPGHPVMSGRARGPRGIAKAVQSKACEIQFNTNISHISKVNRRYIDKIGRYSHFGVGIDPSSQQNCGN